ncbi:MAG: type II toxin-antitoxin system VapC family toxin [Nanoarchaeota archaeon]
MIYLDANIFIYPNTGEGAKSGACITILNKVIKNEMQAGTSVLTWDEVHYALQKEIGKEKATEQSKELFTMPNLALFGADIKTIESAQQIVEKYNLKPRDAIHVATAILNNCVEIISDDSDFDRIRELKRIKL